MLSNLPPIVFIHKGNSWYLPYTLYQAEKQNPDTTIYLIGNAANKHFSKLVRHVDIGEYAEAGANLSAVYRHNSSLGQEFEFLCIERWFILNQFMLTHNINSCIYSDSDILMYADLSRHFARLNHSGMTWESFSAHTNYISDQIFLQKYCDLVIDLYSGKTFSDEFKNESHFFRINAGSLKMNISDMSFFHDYNLLYQNILLHVDRPNNAGVIDAMLDDARYFETDKERFKNIVWEKKTPYVTEKTSQTRFPMLTLHFQGRGKQRLKQSFTEKSLYFFYILINNSVRLIFDKIVRKLKHSLCRK